MASNEQVIRMALQTILLGCFIAAISNATYKLFQYRTSISKSYVEDYIVLPALTICPLSINDGIYPSFKKGQNKTLVQLMAEVPPMENFILNATLTVSDHPFNDHKVIERNTKRFGKVKPTAIRLLKISLFREVYNMLEGYTLESVRLVSASNLGRCITLNPPRSTIYLSAATVRIINMYFLLYSN